MVNHRRFATRDEAITAIFDYSDCFYIRIRLHSTLGLNSPLAYESKLN
jgi:putative transposase